MAQVMCYVIANNDGSYWIDYSKYRDRYGANTNPPEAYTFERELAFTTPATPDSRIHLSGRDSKFIPVDPRGGGVIPMEPSFSLDEIESAKSLIEEISHGQKA